MSPRRPQTCLTLAGLALFTSLLAGPLAGQAPSSRRAFDAIPTERLVERSREASSAQDYDLAAELYQEVLIREPANIDAIIELADVYERDGKLEYAQGLLLRAERLRPGDSSIRERRESVEALLAAVLTEEVESLMFRSQYDLAIPKLGLHLTLEPKNGKLYYLRASCFLEKGQLRSALSDVQRAITLSPEKAYYDLRQRIVEEQQGAELASHMKRAKPLAESMRPEDQREIRVLLTEILQLDPENKWARSELERMTRSAPRMTVAVTADTTSAAKMELARARKDAKKRAALTAAAERARSIAREMQDIATGVSPTLVWVGAFLFVAWVALRSPLARAVVRRFERTPLLAGRLAEFDLTEVLMTINAEPRTGVLHVKGKRGEGRIFFDKGEPCHCTAGKLEGVAALTLLLDNPTDGVFTFERVTVPLVNTIETPLSLILAERSRRRAHASDGDGDADAPKKSRMKELLESRS